MHDHGDGLTAAISGAVLTIVCNVAGWVDGSTFGWELLHAVLFGVIGGGAGYLGKQLIEKLVKANKQK